MKVLLIGNYEPDDQNSMLAFRRVLERELPRAGCEVRVAAPQRRLLRGSRTARGGKWLGYLDKFVLFPPGLGRQVAWADVVHIADHSNAMYVRWVRSKPNLVTCHDVIAVQAALGMIEGWQVGRSGRLFQRLISRGLGEADRIACVSDLTRRELLALGLAPADRVDVVLNGLNDDFAPVPAVEADGLLARFGLSKADAYLIHVGSELPRKNRLRVLQAFIALRERALTRGEPALADRLVFVGPELTPDMRALAASSGVADRVLTLQNVSHPELRALYSAAVALLFPSLQEGFGWPIIEAQACACPVVTSDLAPMNEIGGDAACYVDPLDPQAMAIGLEHAALGFDRMREQGLANAAGYSAASMARRYVECYRQVVAGRGVAA